MKFRDLPEELKVMIAFAGLILTVIVVSIIAILVGLVYIAKADNVQPYTYKGEVVACMEK